MRNLIFWFAAFLLLGAIGCEAPAPVQEVAASDAAGENQAHVDALLASRRLELDRAAVIFTVERLTLDVSGGSVTVPVTVGSHPGPDTLSSDDPDIVSIEEDGRLQPHREGRTRIRSRNTGGKLEVVVQSRAALRADWESGRTSVNGGTR